MIACHELKLMAMEFASRIAGFDECPDLQVREMKFPTRISGTSVLFL
jgi:hypothetical protein